MMGKRGRGPSRRLAELLLAPFLDARERGEVLVELDELFELRGKRRMGRLGGELWYWLELVRYMWRLWRHGSELDRQPGRRGAGVRSAVGSGLLFESILADIRIALRSFARSPGLAAVAAGTIALVVGANTAVFSFADALFLRQLPVEAPDRLLSLLHVTTGEGHSYSSFSYPDFVELRDETRSFAGLAAHSSVELDLGEAARAEPLEGLIVSWNYFSVLGVRPLIGRDFLPEEDRTEGSHPVAIVSHTLWERAFGADPDIAGREVVLNGMPFTVVGVAPPSTPTPDLGADPDVWVPLMMHPVVLPAFRIGDTELFYNRGSHWLELLGRLEDGVSRMQAADEVRVMADRQAEANPETNAGWTIVALPTSEIRTGPPGSRGLLGLTGLLGVVVGLVLLIGCANVANLLLGRSIARRGEMGVRIAIGAGRGRVVRQVLTEALVLALLGTGMGVLLALGSMRFLESFGVSSALPGLDVRLDWRALGFAGVLCVLTGIASGVAPALRASSGGQAHAGVRWGSDSAPGRASLRHGLIVVQVALSLVLLIGSGLALRTLWNLRAVPLGFDLTNLRVTSVDLADAGVAPERQGETYRRLVAGARELKGTRAAALAFVSPFSRMRMANDVLWRRRGDEGDWRRTNVDLNVVDAGYFATMDIPLVRGRAFTDGDVAGSLPVAVVNQAMAARLWPAENPVGQTFLTWNPNGEDQAVEVVGVAADGRYYRSWRTAGRPFAFLPLAQHPMGRMSLLVRGSTDRLPSAPDLRAALAATDARIPRSQVHSVNDAMNQAILLELTSARLLTLFGALALVIASIGIYGVVSFSVNEKAHEIGVRMALGARGVDVHRVVLSWSAAPLVLGAVLGWLSALALTRYMAGLLYGVEPRDPTTFAAVGTVLIAIGLLAGFVPARRATRVHPLRSLQPD